MPPRAYTISKLANDANVSVHMVRNYEQRGLLCACEYMAGGFRVYDEHALLRMRFIRAGICVGITLDDMAILLNSLDKDNLQQLIYAAQQMHEQLVQQIQRKEKFSKLLNYLIRHQMIPAID